jgi:hypothetical protein
MKLYVEKKIRFGRADYKPSCVTSNLVCEWKGVASLTAKDLQFLKILGYEIIEKESPKKLKDPILFESL